MFRYNDKNLASYVLQLYSNNEDINKISFKTGLLVEEVIYILYFNKINLSEEEIINYHINDEKFIIISDTHFGSNKDNNVYLERVYEFATINNINTILHCGDLIQSTIGYTRKKLTSNELQIEYVINNYPFSKDIDNYLLLGNHDFHAIKKNNDLWQLLNSRDDLNIIGFKKAYLKWLKNNISLSHRIDKYHVQIPNLKTIVNFIGHRHSFQVKNDSIYVPTLSDDLKYYGKDITYPGFLVANINDYMIYIEYYTFNIGFEDKGLVYSKNIV